MVVAEPPITPLEQLRRDLEALDPEDVCIPGYWLSGKKSCPLLASVDRRDEHAQVLSSYQGKLCFDHSRVAEVLGIEVETAESLTAAYDCGATKAEGIQNMLTVLNEASS